MAGLPEGFELDQTSSIPEGFVMDSGAPQKQPAPIRNPVEPNIRQKATDIAKQGLKGAVGAEEVLLSMMTGSVREAISGGAGVFDLVSNIVSGENDPLGGAVQTIENVRNKIPSYTPNTEQGQQFLDSASAPMERFAQFAQDRGDVVLEETGSPALATVEQVMVEGAPGIIGMRNPLSPSAPNAIGDMTRRSRDVRQVKKDMESIGVDPNAKIEQQGVQVVEGAQRVAAQDARGGNLESLQQAVINAYEASKKNAKRLYDEAKEGNATFSLGAAKTFAKDALDSITSEFQPEDLADMPRLRARVVELEKILKFPDNGSISINDLAAFRRRLNRKAPLNDVAQNTGLGMLKGQVDAFMQDLFDSDMVSGDPQAIMRWRTANNNYRQHSQMFKDDRTIRNMIEQEATPEQISNWIIGASSTGAKAQSGLVVQKLKDIVGEDTPEFNAIRQEVIYDITKPLLQETPNFRTFINKYNSFVSRNPTLAKELFPDSYGELQKLKRQSEALLRSGGAKINFDLNSAVARALWGHGIAKAGLRVQLARQGIDLMRRAAEGTDQRKIMSELAGYDVGKTVLPTSTVTLTGAAPQQEDQQ